MSGGWWEGLAGIIDWVAKVYHVSGTFPADERSGLTSQIRTAAASVPANIAEGAARTGTKEVLRFLSVASGSLAETETFLIRAERLRMIDASKLQELLDPTDEIRRMLSGLAESASDIPALDEIEVDGEDGVPPSETESERAGARGNSGLLA